MRAATGMQLKQSTKAFQSLMLYLERPALLKKYIPRKNRKYG
jgi:hypothetical protein